MEGREGGAAPSETDGVRGGVKGVCESDGSRGTETHWAPTKTRKPSMGGKKQAGGNSTVHKEQEEEVFLRDLQDKFIIQTAGSPVQGSVSLIGEGPGLGSSL